jgi:hypothetical protein
MPTLEHNALVEMFRENPELAPHLLALLFHVDVPPHASALVVESSLDQLIPVEFLADLVLELRDASGALVLVIVLEVQREKDPDKEYSWPVYVSVLREEALPDSGPCRRARRRRCSVGSAADRSGIGIWDCPTGSPGPGERAFGDGPSARRARDGARGPLGRGARQQAERLRCGPSGARRPRPARPGARGGVLSNHLERIARALIQWALEALVMERQAEGETKFPPFVQRIFEQGIHEGELKGRLEGELKGKRETLLRLLARSGITLTEDQAARVRACDDPALLDRWVDNVLGAKTASDVLS